MEKHLNRRVSVTVRWIFAPHSNLTLGSCCVIILFHNLESLIIKMWPGRGPFERYERCVAVFSIQSVLQ